jgi:hypothetical protein
MITSVVPAAICTVDAGPVVPIPINGLSVNPVNDVAPKEIILGDNGRSSICKNAENCDNSLLFLAIFGCPYKFI